MFYLLCQLLEISKIIIFHTYSNLSYDYYFKILGTANAQVKNAAE